MYQLFNYSIVMVISFSLSNLSSSFSSVSTELLTIPLNVFLPTNIQPSVSFGKFP